MHTTTGERGYKLTTHVRLDLRRTHTPLFVHQHHRPSTHRNSRSLSCYDTLTLLSPLPPPSHIRQPRHVLIHRLRRAVLAATETPRPEGPTGRVGKVASLDDARCLQQAPPLPPRLRFRRSCPTPRQFLCVRVRDAPGKELGRWEGTGCKPTD